MRYNNLQLLRLVAASAVALFHLGIVAGQVFGVRDGPVPYLLMPRFATLWVPLFFATSAFVLSHALQTAPAGRYVCLRMLRLYPAYWLTIVGVLALIRLGGWPDGYPFPVDPSWASLLLLPIKPSGMSEHVLLVEWTLVYEAYLSLALLGLAAVCGRHRLAGGAVVWLIVLALKCILVPGYGSYMFPSWKSIALSVYIVPFLFGILAYHVKDWNVRTWPAMVLMVGLNAVSGVWLLEHEIGFWLRGVAAGLIVWLAVRWPDAPARNRLVVAGGYTYGLYLLHFPAMILAFQVMKRSEMLSGTWIGVGLAGCFAISSGLAFGWLELRLYDRLKRAFDSLSRFTSCWTARLTRIGLDRPSIHPVRRGDTRR